MYAKCIKNQVFLRKTRFRIKILMKQFVNQNQIFDNNKSYIKTKNYGTWKI